MCVILIGRKTIFRCCRICNMSSLSCSNLCLYFVFTYSEHRNLPQPSASSYPIPMAGLTALHSHQIGRNLQCITPFNSKQNVHLGAGSCPSGPCASNGPGMRSPDQHLVGTPSCSGILLPKVVDHRVHGNI